MKKLINDVQSFLPLETQLAFEDDKISLGDNMMDDVAVLIEHKMDELGFVDDDFCQINDNTITFGSTDDKIIYSVNDDGDVFEMTVNDKTYSLSI